MVVLDYGKRQVALILSGSTTTIPSYFMIGSGSGTVVSTQTELFSPTDRQLVTSVNGSSTYKVKFTGDWSNLEVSGTSFREWGVFISGTGLTGSAWSKTCINSLFEFNGTEELRIEEAWEVY